MNESQRLRRFAFRAPKFYLVLPLIVVLIPLFYFTSLDLRFTLIYTLSIVSLIIWDLLSPRIFKFKFPPPRVLFLNVVSLYFATIFLPSVIFTSSNLGSSGEMKKIPPSPRGKKVRYFPKYGS